MRCRASTATCVISASNTSAITMKRTIMETARTIFGINQLRARLSGGFAASYPSATGRLCPLLFTLSTGTQKRCHSCVTGSMKDRGMNTQLNDSAIDEIVATCNGDIRGALKAMMLVNEQLEAELQQLHAAFAKGDRKSTRLNSSPVSESG